MRIKQRINKLEKEFEERNKSLVGVTSFMEIDGKNYFSHFDGTLEEVKAHLTENKDNNVEIYMIWGDKTEKEIIKHAESLGIKTDLWVNEE